VSRHVNNLEDFLGCSLFTRGKKGAILTKLGQKFYDDVAPALVKIRNAAIECHAVSAQNNLLHVSASSSFAVKWLTPRLHKFQKKSPRVLTELTISDTCPDFSSGLIDAAVIPEAKVHASGTWQHLFDEILVPVCSPIYAKGYLLESPEDLLKGQLIHTTTRPKPYGEAASIKIIQALII